MTKNVLYTVNGAVLVFLFLASRVMFVPITVTIYAAQYHQWDVLQALRHMRAVCHLANALQLGLQTYWFVLLLRLAVRVVRGWTGEVQRSTRRSSEDRIRTSTQDTSFHVKEK